MLRKNLLLLFAVLAFAAHCPPGYAAEFTLLFSNDIRGEIEPCG